MDWSVRTNKQIRELFKDEPELMKRLLSENETIRKEAIRQIGLYSNAGITPEEFVNAYNNKTIDDLYKREIRKIKIRILYYELNGEEPPKILVNSLKK